MFKEYLAYLKDNPKGYWFKAKLYGWGWVPVKWQGWAVILIYIALVTSLLANVEKEIPGNSDSGTNFLVLGLPIILLSVLLIIVCYKKGEKPRWQWGPPKK